MAGTPCIDWQAHPKPFTTVANNIYVLLNEVRAGCGTATGADTNLAVKAGETDFKAF